MAPSARAAQPADADVLYALACEAMGCVLDRRVFDLMLRSSLSGRQRRVALATWEGAPVGWGEMDVSYSLTADGLTATLDELYVRPSARGKGAGRALLIHLAGEARRMGCRRILANCSRVNLRSRDFLERNGFVLARAQYEFRLKAGQG